MNRNGKNSGVSAKVMKREKKKNEGFSIVEILLAAFILLIAYFGAARFAIHSVKAANMADYENDAAQLAQLLCETWRGLEGSSTFDPVYTFQDRLTFYDSYMDTAMPNGFTRLGQYEVVLNDVSFWVNLAWKDETASLRVLNVVVSWDRDATGRYEYMDSDKSYKLTTYVLTN